jgi:hypothetical protein
MKAENDTLIQEAWFQLDGGEVSVFQYENEEGRYFVLEAKEDTPGEGFTFTLGDGDYWLSKTFGMCSKGNKMRIFVD